ncbi:MULTISPECIES: preprotein translocase subunit SecD [Haloferax]|uniref:Protein-export membrane protein SecD n=2 Tax=Haloferax TaxID=2251 RepID=A0A6G1Z0M6_9EURY|nr:MULTISPECIES: preprotein translocase subunit SecD [Haloferax]KAB1187427.1 preprotein translocase subunit SecD [Haloferax sp. CBA1149]MRW80076.1 preprotein translocase subunit SecD [Haloferax marinisediminis]
MSTLRDNWRVILLVIAILVSTFALFSPTVGSQPAIGEDDSMTNLKFGLQLDGGTRIRAPLVGVTAEDVEFNGDSERVVEQQVAAQLPTADAADIIARQGAEGNTVEATIENVTTDDLSTALDAAGYAHGEVRDGVTETTRTETVRVLESKINEAGLSGGTVQQVTTATGEHFILVEVPNRDRQDVIDLVGERGTVQIDIYYPTTQNGTRVYETQEAVLSQADFTSIGTAQEPQTGGGAFVPVSVRDQPAQDFQEAVVDTGLAQQGGTRCTYMDDPNTTDGCLLLVVNGEVVNSFGMSPGLADGMRSGEWANAPSFQLQTRNTSEAQEIAINLRAGALPAKLDLSGQDGGTSSYISPSQGESFKTDSLFTGIIAVLAVAGVVFLRYGKPEVALPMIVTGLSEVYVLLGFAAAIGYPLDLSVIAGFIAVIGTGVDDLIIIADEVMAEGSVKSRKVFQSRFRRAFWIIGAAAATTIIAMSPLAILSLGDLQGFAIFTILGVIVGVLVTRPAYGDILRLLLTEDR